MHESAVRKRRSEGVRECGDADGATRVERVVFSDLSGSAAAAAAAAAASESFSAAGGDDDGLGRLTKKLTESEDPLGI